MKGLGFVSAASIFAAFGCGASFSAQHDEALRWSERVAEQDAATIAANSERASQTLSMERAASLAVALSPQQSVAAGALRVRHAEVDAVGTSLRPEVRVFALPGVSGDPTRYDVALRVRPDHPGEVRARRGAARLRVVAGRYDVEAQREAVATSTRVVFSQVSHLRRSTALLREEVRLGRELRDLAGAARGHGVITEDDAFQTENALADLELEMADENSDLRQAEQALRQLVGLPEDAPLLLEAEEEVTMRVDGATGPLLAAAEARRLAAEREVAAANWRRTPWISFLQLEARVDGQEQGRLGFSVGVEIPLFDAGGRHVRVREAEVGRLGAVREATEHEGVQALSASLFAVERAVERHALIAESLLPSARARAASLEAALFHGSAERAAVLRARKRVLALERRLCTAEGELARARHLHRLDRYLYQGTERSLLERTP